MSLTSLRELVTHFVDQQRWFVLPLLLVLLLAGALFAATQGMSIVAPLVYTLF